MGRRKKAAAKFEAWCWYCDRDFEDEKVLLQHQRAKHYRCPYCPRRLNTSGGLTVHLHQVHKAEPTTIENALPGRESFDIEIYGMVGIPHDDLVEWQARKEKRGLGGGDAAYGGANGASKRPKIDKGVIPIEQLRMQLEAHKALMSGKAPPPGFGFGAPIGFPPPSFNVPPPGYAGPPPGMSPFQRPPPPFGVPPPPMAGGAMPPFSGPPPGYPNVPPPSLLPAAAAAQSKATSLPTYNPHEQAVKQGAKTRIVYADTNVSPEEKLASTSKYRYVDPTEAQQPPPAAIPYPPPNYSVPPPGFAPPAATHVPPPQPHAQSYPAAMHSGGLPASANPLANTAEALAAVNASVGVAGQQQREADMKHMQSKADVAMAGGEATPEPVGMTEAAVANDASTGSAPATRSGRKRASDLF